MFCGAAGGCTGAGGCTEAGGCTGVGLGFLAARIAAINAGKLILPSAPLKELIEGNFDIIPPDVGIVGAAGAGAVGCTGAGCIPLGRT
jgi:hypothetical protein